MPEVLAKVSSVPVPWSISTDPAGLLTITPAAPLLVQYSTGGSDTVAAGVAAAECPVDAAFVWVPYIVPGSGTLHVAKEADLAALSGNWTALGHVHQHEVVPHQVAGAGGPAAISFIVSGDGAAFGTGYAGSLVVPYACTILSCTLLADTSTSTVLDIQQDTYSTFPSATSIVASAPPTLSAAVKAQDSTLTGWATALAAGDILRYIVSSSDNATELTCVLLVAKS